MLEAALSGALCPEGGGMPLRKRGGGRRQRAAAGRSSRCVRKTPPSAKPAANVINVYLSKLDKLQDIMGELVIAESIAESALFSCDGVSDQAAAAMSRLKKLTDAMRSVIMSIRMTSVSDLFHKMRRVARDTARKLGKEVEFLAEGSDIVADKGILDVLSDVLSHVVRNAITHGIEEARTSASRRENRPPAGSR
ncbi:MAG: hypothetical protein ACLUEQ_04335 [Cloacibacillus evryensis]